MINFPLLYKNAYVTPDVTAKYVFSNQTANTTSASTIVAAYDGNDTDSSTIETAMGLGTPGILIVQVSYTRLGSYLRETINVDKTNVTTFWNDIKNWLYMNNYSDIIYIPGSDKWILDDNKNKSYFHIKYISG